MTRPQADAQGERDAIVAWLNRGDGRTHLQRFILREAADAIKRGEHQPLTRKD